jgi:hypothetical protein
MQTPRETLRLRADSLSCLEKKKHFRKCKKEGAKMFCETKIKLNRSNWRKMRVNGGIVDLKRNRQLGGNPALAFRRANIY